MSDQRTSYRLDGAGTITLSATDRRTTDNRASFDWVIHDEAGKQIGYGHDLNSGVSMTPTAREMLPSLLH